MCARYTVTKNPQDLAKRFKVDTVDGQIKLPRYNIAPTQEAPVVYKNSGKRTLTQFRFGLIPSWSKDISIGQKMFNARVETLTEKVSFKKLLKDHRCLVVSDGFYE